VDVSEALKDFGDIKGVYVARKLECLEIGFVLLAFGVI